MLGKVKGMLAGKPLIDRTSSSQRRETKHIKSDKQRGRVWGETTRGQDLKDATDVKASAKPAADAAMIKKAIEKTNVGSRMSPEHMNDLIDHMEVRAVLRRVRNGRQGTAAWWRSCETRSGGHGRVPLAPSACARPMLPSSGLSTAGRRG